MKSLEDGEKAMKERDFLTFYEKESENVYPAKVKVSRRVGSFDVIFEVDGFRGEKTGEIYYSRDTALAIENILERTNNQKTGKAYTFTTPQFVYDDVDTEKAFRLSEKRTTDSTTLPAMSIATAST